METTSERRAARRQRTRHAIRREAMALFARRGFDRVTTVEVAAAAAVSPATVFNHFPTKEDLFFGQVAELEQRLVDLVAAVPPGQSILAALQGHVLHDLTAGRAATDPPAVASFHAMLLASPALRAREAAIFDRRALVLAGALGAAGHDELTARVAARQFVAAEQVVAAELRLRLPGGPSPAAVLAGLEPLIARVFDLLRTGVGDLASAPA